MPTGIYTRIKIPIIDRLFKYREIKPSPDGKFQDCWYWTKSKNKENGYGLIKNDCKMDRVHRLAAHLWLDFDLDSKLEVCHKCNNTICFNPDHLFIGTHYENMKHMVLCGRSCNQFKNRKEGIEIPSQPNERETDMWESIKGRSGGFGYEPMGEDEVSIVTSKRKPEAPPSFRVNIHRNMFPADARCIKLMIDRETNRIGFFKITEEEALANEGKKICSMGKNNIKMSYINLPKSITSMGFVKGRYEILHSDKNKDMYFYIKASKRKEDKKKEEVKE